MGKNNVHFKGVIVPMVTPVAKKVEIDRAWSLFTQTEDPGKIYQGERNLGESLAALKTIMAFLGFCNPFVLPPLTAIAQEDSKRIIENFEEQIFQFSNR